jgi:tetratricopeptide (TPR) repeat protein
VIPLNAIFQENRGYLAVIVFAVFAGVILNKLKIPASVVILIILVLSYGAGTVYRNSVWQDGMSLWSDAVAKSPESSHAHTNMGTEYARRGMNEEAIGNFLKALRLSGSDGGEDTANIHYNLGTVYQKMGREDMAVREYQAVIELSPADFRPWYNLGVIYQQKGELDAAMKAYEIVIERNRYHFKSYHNLGLLYHNRNEISLAAEFYRKALSINPDYARSRVNLEEIYKQEGR